MREMFEMEESSSDFLMPLVSRHTHTHSTHTACHKTLGIGIVQ